MPVFTMTEEREEVVLFSHPFILQEVGSPYQNGFEWLCAKTALLQLAFIFRFPKQRHYTGNPVFRAYSMEVWSVTLIAVLMTTLLLSVCEFIRLAAPFFELFTRQISNIMALFTHQGIRDVHKASAAYTVLIMVWGWGSLLLATFYSSHFLAVALDTSIPLPFHSLQDFADCILKGKCEMVMNTLSIAYMEWIRTAVPGHLHYPLKQFDIQKLIMNRICVFSRVSLLCRALQRRPVSVNAEAALGGILLPSLYTRATYNSLGTLGGIMGSYPPCTFMAVSAGTQELLGFPLPKNATALKLRLAKREKERKTGETRMPILLRVCCSCRCALAYAFL